MAIFTAQQPNYTSCMLKLKSQLSVAQALQNKAEIPNVVAAYRVFCIKVIKMASVPPMPSR